jgi:hypothetical protein
LRQRTWCTRSPGGYDLAVREACHRLALPQSERRSGADHGQRRKSSGPAPRWQEPRHVGRSWATGTARANHVDQTVAWSPDSNWLLVGDSGKWALEAIAVYAVDENASAIKGLGLFRAISAAAARVLRERVGARKLGAYTIDIAGARAEVADTGAVVLPMLFQIPKQDQDVDLLVRFKASRSGDRVSTTPINVSVVKH